MTTRIYLLLITCLLTPITQSRAQAWKWVQSLGPANNATTVKTINAYPDSTLLVCGSFAASVMTLGGNILQSAGQDDGYAALVDPNGQFIWATRFGGTGRDYVTAAAAAPNGAFCIAGNFNSLSMNIGGYNLLNVGESDGYIIKYNQDKTVAWALQIGTADLEEISAVAMDGAENVVVCGHVLDKFTQRTIYAFVRKLDASGNLLWEQKSLSSGGTVESAALALDDNGNVFFGGKLYGTADFGGTMLSSSEDAGFIVQYNAAGLLQHYHINTDLTKFNAIQVHGDKLFACGEKINYQFGWGWPLANSKIHVLRLNSADLSPVWYRSAGGTKPFFSLDIAQNMSLDEQDNLYVTGYFFSDTLHFAGQDHFNPFNINYFYPQIFVLKYAPDGEERWAKTMGGILNDEGTGILAMGEDKFFLGGNFDSDPAVFGKQSLHNTGAIDSIHVHLRPSRYFRPSMGYLALFDPQASGASAEPIQVDFSMYPNPATDRLRIQIENPSSLPFTVHITGCDGRLMQWSRHNGDEREFYEHLDGLLPGVYWLSILSDSGVGKRLFIKQ